MQTTDTSNFLRAESELVLTEERRKKSERIRTLGSPIQLAGKALAIEVIDGHAWIGESTAVARKINLETGKPSQVLRGHTAPITTIAFCDKEFGSGDRKLLISGSWDKTIRIWDTESKTQLNSTNAHSDFVKKLFVLPSINVLVSGGSDKVVRLWDLSKRTDSSPLVSVGSISAHSRPVECIEGFASSDMSATLYTADTMGLVKVWDLNKDEVSSQWRITLQAELDPHRTRINDICYGAGQLWTASSDDFVKISTHPPDSSVPAVPGIQHRSAVRAILPLGLTVLGEPYLLTGSGDVVRVYDLSSPQEPELISEVDAHWHDVTALRLWVRKTTGDDGLTRVEPWIVSASLDGTIRKWRLSELLDPNSAIFKQAQQAEPQSQAPSSGLTAEEEQELAELMDSD